MDAYRAFCTHAKFHSGTFETYTLPITSRAPRPKRLPKVLSEPGLFDPKDHPFPPMSHSAMCLTWNPIERHRVCFDCHLWRHGSILLYRANAIARPICVNLGFRMLGAARERNDRKADLSLCSLRSLAARDPCYPYHPWSKQLEFS